MAEEGAARKLTLFSGREEAGRRVDQVVAERIPALSRSRVQRLIAAGLVTVNGRPVRPGDRLRPGERLEVVIPLPEPAELRPQEIPLSIVYEDADVVVLDKPAGLVVHPAPGHPHSTLVNALLARYPDLAVGGALRPGIVHRLDRFTSGLIVVARNDAAHQALVAQQKERTMLKAYLALVDGHMPEREGVIDAPIGRHPRRRRRMAVVSGGRPARTAYRVLEELGPYTLLEARLETGRTHQIRVHLAHSGHPVLGDDVYGRRGGILGLGRQFLHAYRLGFRLPGSGVYREFRSPLPEDLASVLEGLRRRYGNVDRFCRFGANGEGRSLQNGPASLTGVVLAGGLSRRLGQDKALLRLEGEDGPSLLEVILSRLQAVCDELLVVSDGPRPWPELSARIVFDRYPGGGALGGLYTGLLEASFPFILAVACDMPFLSVPLLAYMADLPRRYDVLIPRLHPTGQDLPRLEPLHAIYGRPCLEPMRNLLEQGEHRIIRFFPQVYVRYLEPEEWARFDPPGLSFRNINTPQDLEEARSLLRHRSRA